MTREQAIKIAESGIWKDMTDEQIVRFQLFEERLCMDFDRFHEAVEAVLGRPVWSHEFCSEGTRRLQSEYLGEREAPTMEEIMALIPPHLQIIPIIVDD